MACAGIVLTGGTSRRLGFDKATVRIGPETLATRAARVLGEACAPLVEVGPGHTGLRAVREEPAGSGPLAALVAGADAVRSDRVVLLACDLVRIEPGFLRWLAELPGLPTAIPVVDGRAQLVCARYGPDALTAARRLVAAGERSLKAMVAAITPEFLDASRWGPVAAIDAFADLDTPADLADFGLRPPG